MSYFFYIEYFLYLQNIILYFMAILTKPEAEKEKMPVGDFPFYKFFNFKKVSDFTGIQQDKIYNNLKQSYNSLSKKDKREIFQLLRPQVEKLFKALGYSVEFKKLDA